MKKLRILLMPGIALLEIFALMVCLIVTTASPKHGQPLVAYCIGKFPSRAWYSGRV